MIAKTGVTQSVKRLTSTALIDHFWSVLVLLRNVPSHCRYSTKSETFASHHKNERKL